MQKAFSPIHTILLLIVVGIIGFTGWYVSNSQQKTELSLKQTENQQVSKPTTKPNQLPETKITEPKDYTKIACAKPVMVNDSFQCKLVDLGVQFEYPINWNLEGVVSTAKTSEYETNIGIAGGGYKFDSKAKKWIDMSTNKQLNPEAKKYTNNPDYTVYDLGGGDAGCTFNKLIFEAKDSLVIVNAPVSCDEETIITNNSSTKYTSNQKQKDLINFINSINPI